jgi:hypothetical protein
MFPFSEINWITVLIGVVVSNGLGFLWYGPLFGQAWLRMIGKKQEDLEATTTMYLTTALASLITMIALNLVVVSFGATGFFDGVLVGALALIGFSATATFVYTNFEGPPTNIWALYVAYQLAVFIIMGGIFAVWR